MRSVAHNEMAPENKNLKVAEGKLLAPAREWPIEASGAIRIAIKKTSWCITGKIGLG
jgi:hypothetical protein